ncbi:m-AAA protease-interacting protein 1, mitochondrial [Oratosquilla oratoria]|uniref:m-AAA protease-interacting protein 1, mitochondrial n=1 Tax=Oratosquilla oratoria TaxID=337810 RepID=UPI003F76040E
MVTALRQSWQKPCASLMRATMVSAKYSGSYQHTRQVQPNVFPEKQVSYPHWSSTRYIHRTSAQCQNSNDDSKGTRMRVMYIPNPFKWFNNILQMGKLKREWDANFSEAEFKRGALQAVCTITDLVQRREWGELRGLMSQHLISSLRSHRWSMDEASNLTLQPNNIQVVTVTNVGLQVIVEKKYCDIDIGVIATRMPANTHKHALIALEYAIRFHREYTEGKLPEWTVTKFELCNFQAVERPYQ